ncbi:PBIP1 protein, partial [Formicarius rufipectus]|nr:PBIP1 protein [Formicarius rufipectus]
DPEECVGPRAQAVPDLDSSIEPSVTKGDEQEESDAENEPQSCPDTPKAGSPTEDGSCTSSDNDTEGLRRRQGHKPHPGPPTATPTPHRETPDTGGEDGLSMSKYLLGALALVAVGLLIITGEWGSQVAEGPGTVAPNLPVPQDSQQKPTLPDAGDPQSVQSMNQLLDKLAKENQEIRLMQAELQAHKDELRALLHRSEGEAAAAGAQQQSLAVENARLRAALEREVSALRDAQAELQRLQARGAPSSPREPSAEQPCATGASAHSKAATRWHGEL